jgi:hypothetical protein
LFRALNIKKEVTPVPVLITKVKLFSTGGLPRVNWWVQVAAESFFIEKSLIQIWMGDFFWLKLSAAEDIYDHNKAKKS